MDAPAGDNNNNNNPNNNNNHRPAAAAAAPARHHLQAPQRAAAFGAAVDRMMMDDAAAMMMIDSDDEEEEEGLMGAGFLMRQLRRRRQVQQAAAARGGVAVPAAAAAAPPPRVARVMAPNNNNNNNNANQNQANNNNANNNNNMAAVGILDVDDDSDDDDMMMMMAMAGPPPPVRPPPPRAAAAIPRAAAAADLPVARPVLNANGANDDVPIAQVAAAPPPQQQAAPVAVAAAPRGEMAAAAAVPPAAAVAPRPAAAAAAQQQQQQANQHFIGMRDRHIERRRRRIRFRMRAEMMAGLFMNDDNNDPLGAVGGLDNEQEQRILDQLEQNHNQAAMPWGMAAAAAAAGGGGGQAARAAAQAAAAVSPYLMDLVREDLPCSSVLSGANVRGCNTIVQRCTEHPEEASYQCSRTGRTPLHEAALRCACHHVVTALLAIDNVRALHLDARQNTPLHLLFLGISNRRMNPADLERIVEQLLQPLPNMVSTIRNRDGYLPLHCAAAAPETMVPIGTMERLLAASPSAAARTTNQEQTPLHLHCRRRNASPQVAQMLLEAFGNALRQRDRAPGGGFTPLHYAAAHSNRPLLELLCRFDADAAKTRTTETDKTPLHILCEKLPQHSTRDNLACVQALLATAPETATWPDQTTRYTPLHIVCRRQAVSLQVVQALVQAAPAALQRTDHNQYLPLHYAAEHGADAAVIECLLQAYPAAASIRTRKRDTALHLACTAANHKSAPQTIRLLLQANPGAALLANDYGLLPLHVVCRAYQASTACVQVLLSACPQAVLRTTTPAGESALHLAGRNTAACLGILDILQRTYIQQAAALQQEQNDPEMLDHNNNGAAPAVNVARGGRAALPAPPPQQQQHPHNSTGGLTSAVGNTPLHLACFRTEFSRPHIESLAESNPEWITIRNNAGYSPLQILCKNGRIDSRIVTLFSRLCGPEIFSSVDLMGNTPLHSAMREETDLEALRAIIRAYPDALHMKTTYEDTPLHLACLRGVHPDIVHEVALASSIGLEKALAQCNGRISPLLIQNTAGQTPIGIAMESFQKHCHGTAASCNQADLSGDQMRSFETLSSLCKMLHYGPTEDNNKGLSLVGACVALHRKGARIDPAFIHRALNLYPEEARLCDENGDTPLHIEASIPVEKMSLLDSTPTTATAAGNGAPGGATCTGSCHQRMTVLRRLLEIYPEATQQRNNFGDFPLNLMVQNGRPWDSTFALVIRTYPEAFHWVRNIDSKLNPRILALMSNECGSETLFSLIRTRPEFLG